MSQENVNVGDSPKKTGEKSVKPSFNSRFFWTDMIETPPNKWTFSCQEIIDKLDVVNERAPIPKDELKKIMEKCLMYFYTLKKKLNLFDHTYTASSIYFFRFWYMNGLPSNLLTCIHISQALLVTACKTMENNRPIDAYVKATSEFLFQIMPNLKNKYNMDKLKWEVRDKLVENEKRILCMCGFDLNIENPKEMIEDLFSGYYRFNRDFDLPEEFMKIFPKILQESRAFIIQAVTQPISLLCDGHTFVILSLIYCGLQYKEKVDNNFKYPKNFFRDRFPIVVEAKKFEQYFHEYKLLEENFFALKSNKSSKLDISKDLIDSVIDEDIHNSNDGQEEASQLAMFPSDYDKLKTGEVKKELLDHIKGKVEEVIQKTIEESRKRPNLDVTSLETRSPKKAKM